MAKLAWKSFATGIWNDKFWRLIVVFLLISTELATSFDQSEQDRQSSEKIGVGLLWWPAKPKVEEDRFSRRIGKCLAGQVAAQTPDVYIVGNEAVRSMLYPLMEIDTQPQTEEAFGELLASTPVQARLKENDLQFLIAFSGRTLEDDGGGSMLCGGGGCLGFVWEDKETRLNAVLWTLYGSDEPTRVHISKQGTAIMPTILLPVPIPADTQTSACKALSFQIAERIKKAQEMRPAN